MSSKRFKYLRREGATSTYCCVPLCDSSSRFNSVLSFHTFPPDTEIRRKWIHCIRREDLVVTSNTRVCSRHFRRNDVIEPSTPSGRRLLKRGAVPSLFDWNNCSPQRRTEEPVGLRDHDYCACAADVDLRTEVEQLRKQDEVSEHLEKAQRSGGHTRVTMDEIEEVTIEEEFIVKDEETETPIGLMEMKMEAEVKNETGSAGQHNNDHYFTTEEKTFICSETEKTSSEQKIERHFICPQCGKSFSQKGSLNRHVRVHTGEKPYTCPQCGKRYNLKSHLKQHIRVHTGERPFTCSLCGESFVYKSTLNAHIRSHFQEHAH